MTKADLVYILGGSLLILLGSLYLFGVVDGLSQSPSDDQLLARMGWQMGTAANDLLKKFGMID